MIKQEKLNKSSISKTEFELINTLRKSNISTFNIDTLRKLTDFNQEKLYRTLSQMQRKQLIRRLKAGIYSLTLFSEPDELEEATQLVWPSYISFWTALAFYEFTDQLPRTIYIVTTSRVTSDNVKLVTLSKDRFFGYTKIDNIKIADKEKAIIDSLLLPRYAGGVVEVAKCLNNAWKELDKARLVDYALRMKSKSLNKRLGYLAKGLISKTLSKKLKSDTGKGYSLLDPLGEKRGEYDEEWGLIINVNLESMEGVR